MRILIVCHSSHHGNTWKVAQAVAGELGARLVRPKEVTAEEVAGYHVVGFGSGVYQARLHRDVAELVRSLPRMEGRKAFVLTTSGSCSEEYHARILALLRDKGFDTLGTFTCPGRDSFRFPGSELNTDRPDADDLERARAFALDIRERLEG